MDVIKENMFFVVMGLVVLVALGLFVVVVRPLKARNDVLQSDVEGLKTSLARLLSLKDDKLPNRGAIPAAEKFRAGHVEQYDILKTQLSKMSLSTKLPELDEDDPGAFKTVYQKRIAELKGQLSEKGVVAGPDTWHVWDWGDDVPRQEVQRILATKEYSLMSELLAIITSPGLGVKQVDRLEINPGETRTGDYSPKEAAKRDRINPYFDVFPFVLELRMVFQKHELLIRDLLQSKSEIPIYIRTVSMMRLEDDPRVRKLLPRQLLVGVRVEGWVLDYRLEEPKPATPTKPFGGAAPFAAGAQR
ncbi:MAG: hypothetical protein AMK75_02735 [Planctomycetes bacterium SM23_65]|nr:MAG: hypothetical protein AMK75_02735 [Planctomycetes bacterium SM23_65]